MSESRKERIRTHWEGCEEAHHDCALAKLTAATARLREIETDAIYKSFYTSVSLLLDGGAFDLTDSPKSLVSNLRRLVSEIENAAPQGALIRVVGHEDESSARGVNHPAGAAPDAASVRVPRDLLLGAEIWLRGALECPAFKWDCDQHDAATEIQRELKAMLAAAPSADTQEGGDDG